MGLTRIPVRTYFFVSQVGMLLGTVIFVNAGAQLSQCEFSGRYFLAETFSFFYRVGNSSPVCQKNYFFFKVPKGLSSLPQTRAL